MLFRSSVPKEPHPADDLNGADVAHKLIILSRLVPSLRNALPQGYKSMQMTSLILPALPGVSSSDEHAAPVRVCLPIIIAWAALHFMP